MRKLLFLASLFVALNVHAQRLLKGTVVDEKNTPVPSASIFLNNTSIGTRSDANGSFQLHVPAGKYELIVSSIGYETHNQTITSTEITTDITVRLRFKAAELETVVIEPYEKDGWAKWGRFFIDNFIGTSANAGHCRLKNPEVLRFRHAKKKGLLTATAMAPLVIENRALGYIIRYQMESFTYDFTNRYLLYTGFPFFEPMTGKPAQERRWGKARAEVYEGSMMQFMRALYRNNIVQEGFEIRPLKKILNGEKQRVKAVQRNNVRMETKGGLTVMTTISKDSSDYYHRILQQEDEIDVVGKTRLTGDSVGYAVDSVTAGLAFENYLLVIYNKQPAPIEYTRQFPKNGRQMMSQLVLINGRPVEIQSNGLYYSPTDLLTLGYWAWSEKMANMLPFDYRQE